jgi:hypothetical protein
MAFRLKEDPREWRTFAWSASAAAALVGWMASRRATGGGGATWAAAWLGCWVGVAMLAWWRPRWFRGVYRVGMTVGHWIGQGVGRVLLAAIFLIVVTPLGLILRASGKDLLGLKRPRGGSYWRDARPPNPLDRQF